MSVLLSAVGWIWTIRAPRGERQTARRRAGQAIAASAFLGLLVSGSTLDVDVARDAASAGDAQRLSVVRSPVAGDSARRAVRLQATQRQAIAASRRRLPLSFSQNAGQTDRRVRYLAQGDGSSLFFMKRRMVLALIKPIGASEGPSTLSARESLTATFAQTRPASRRLSLQLRFVGANPDVRLEANDRGAGTFNYLVGDKSAWVRGLPTYRELAYRNLWPGIDLLFRGRGGTLKYEFHVAPGADVRAIRLAYTGAEGIARGPRGSLLVHTALGALRDARPASYQRLGGRRVAVESRYALSRTRESYGFALGAGYDRTRPLVIDPGLAYSTLLGGTSGDEGHDIAVDKEGNVYVTGLTASPDYPTTPGAFEPTYNGGDADAFVTKLNPSGSALVYSTLLGGTSSDVGDGISVDRDGAVYVTGTTFSSDYPTTPGAFEPTFNGDGDAFVTKLDASGSALSYSTLLGGTNFDAAEGIAVDEAGSAYVAGVTGSGDYPTTPGAPDQTFDNGEAFVTKLDASGSALAYSTFLGGTDFDASDGIAIDSKGSAYVTGFTQPGDYPTTPGAFEPAFNGNGDAFVTRIDAPGSALSYSTFLGGTGSDEAHDIAVDQGGEAYVTGITLSADYPTTPGAFEPSFNGGEGDAFVTKLDAAGSALSYSTFLGGKASDEGFGLAVDGEGRAYVTGITLSTDYPTTPGAFERSFNGRGDAFVTKLDASGSALSYSTFLGGVDVELGQGIAVDVKRNAYATGFTFSADYPATHRAFDPTPNGSSDAFVTKLRVPRLP